MNALQDFMALGNELARGICDEAVEINGAVYYGTFGDPVLMPVLTKHGTQDHIVTELKISRVQFAANPISKQTLRRPLTNRVFFVQVVDATHPVVYTFILTDREL